MISAAMSAGTIHNDGNRHLPCRYRKQKNKRYLGTAYFFALIGIIDSADCQNAVYNAEVDTGCSSVRNGKPCLTGFEMVDIGFQRLADSVLHRVQRVLLAFWCSCMTTCKSGPDGPECTVSAPLSVPCSLTVCSFLFVFTYIDSSGGGKVSGKQKILNG